MSFGNLGGGGFYGGGGNFGPTGSYGAYPGCGCSTIFFMGAIILLIFGGCLRTVGF
jgi:hypothetical protein